MVVKARKGIPHLVSSLTKKGNPRPALTDHQVEQLFVDGVFSNFKITEKTDGVAWVIGWDENGFFTMHSGSGDQPAREGADHLLRALVKYKKNKKKFNLTAIMGFVDFHNALHDNLMLQQYLNNMFIVHEYQEVILKGEAFINRLSSTEGSKITFNVIPYEAKHFQATVGAFVAHTQLSDNKNHCFDRLEEISSSSVKIMSDRVEFEPFGIYPCSREQLEESLTGLHGKVYDSKWGEFTEGFVFHPKDESLRFKIVSDKFLQDKDLVNYGW